VLEQIDGSLHASVSVTVDGVVVDLLSTEPLFDVEVADGPTAMSHRTGRIIRMPTVQHAEEFPAYAVACRRQGICSTACFPITTGGATVGVLTITSADHHGFGTQDLKTGRAAAAALAPIITSATEVDGVTR
jgi:GAF domain-containing protein